MAKADPRAVFWLAYKNGLYDRFITILGVFTEERLARSACNRAKNDKDFRPEYHQIGIRSVMLDVFGDSQVI